MLNACDNERQSQYLKNILGFTVPALISANPTRQFRGRIPQFGSLSPHLEIPEMWNDSSINTEQKLAIKTIIERHCVVDDKDNQWNPIHIIFGPPGTGKTLTLVELVFQILSHEGVDDCSFSFFAFLL